MNLEKRIKAFDELSNLLRSAYGVQLIAEWAENAYQKNNWFTPNNVVIAINAITKDFLQKESLENWLKNYPIEQVSCKKVGVIMAGNIPLVGFHDAMSVLLSGHKLMAKLSSQDDYLIKQLFNQLLIIEPDFESKIIYAEKMNDAQAIIATGSDNSANYFEYYFKHIPHIIRKNRTSIAILTGNETGETLSKLGSDILQYYGLGCRNVSKIFVPEAFKPDFFYENIESLGDVMLNHKYKNNYDYNRSVLLVNQTKHFDNNFLILKESEELVSPISVVFFEKYSSITDLDLRVNQHNDKIQCILTENGWFKGSLPIGEGQNPALTDYADGVDTMAFLTKL
jgi:Acyl-CoA reductase (LuxC)